MYIYVIYNILTYIHIYIHIYIIYNILIYIYIYIHIYNKARENSINILSNGPI